MNEGRAKKGASTLVALLRGVNLAGKKRVPMRELCRIATELGFADVRSYVQSGNLVFSATLPPAAAEAALERAIAETFGFGVEVIVRSAKDWQAYAQRTPFPDAETERPHLLHIALSKQPPKRGALEVLAPYAKADERFVLRGDALWIDFPNGVARSKVTSAVMDRAIGSTVTARNFRTVQKLAAMASGSAESDA